MADLIRVQRGYRDLCLGLSRTEALASEALKRLEEVESRVYFLEGEVELLERVADLFRALIDKEVIENAKTAQDLLTEGLQAVFDDIDLSVRAEVDISRGKVSVDLITVQEEADGTRTEGLAMDSCGGSVTTVESVLLRLVVLSRRGLRPLLLLDESLAAVAEDYVPRFGVFLRTLSERMGVDILAVSHNPALVETANRAYRIKKKDGAAQFKLVGKNS